MLGSVMPMMPIASTETDYSAIERLSPNTLRKVLYHCILGLFRSEPVSVQQRLEARKGNSGDRKRGLGTFQKTSAYAKLEGPSVMHFVETVCVTLGRERERDSDREDRRKRPNNGDGGVKNELGREVSFDSAGGGEEDEFSESFVSLGRASEISRKHLQVLCGRLSFPNPYFSSLPFFDPHLGRYCTISGIAGGYSSASVATARISATAIYRRSGAPLPPNTTYDV